MENIYFSDDPSTFHRSNAPITLVTEKVLAHYFSPERPGYFDEDIFWFLELANKQEQWSSMELTEQNFAITAENWHDKVNVSLYT